MILLIAIKIRINLIKFYKMKDLLKEIFLKTCLILMKTKEWIAINFLNIFK